ncbi:MAG: PQQ-binding-like beta-propeller repeat protein, partial [Bacteroidota bacterium]
MYLTLRILTLSAFFFLFFSGSAQTTVDFPGEINLVKMTDPGIGIVGTNDALYGVDANGTLLWNNEKLRKVEAERVEVLSGSELVFVSDKGLLARNRVLDVLNGEEYANTGTKGENVFAARIAHGTNQLWVMPNGSNIQVWDIASNRHEYTISLPKGMNVAASRMASLTSTFSGMQPITYTSPHEAILHLSLGHLGKYDLTTGDVIWMTDFKPLKPKADKGDKASNPIDGYGVMKLDPASNTLYFPFRESLLAIDATNGNLKWEVKANKPGKVRDLYVLEEGILVLTEAGLQLINPASGAEKWKKPIKIKGAGEGLLLNDEGTFYAISKNSLVKIDLVNRSSQALTEKIKFQGGESFSQMEVIDDAIVLSSA